MSKGKAMITMVDVHYGKTGKIKQTNKQEQPRIVKTPSQKCSIEAFIGRERPL